MDPGTDVPFYQSQLTDKGLFSAIVSRESQSFTNKILLLPSVLRCCLYPFLYLCSGKSGFRAQVLIGSYVKCYNNCMLN